MQSLGQLGGAHPRVDERKVAAEETRRAAAVVATVAHTEDAQHLCRLRGAGVVERYRIELLRPEARAVKLDDKVQLVVAAAVEGERRHLVSLPAARAWILSKELLHDARDADKGQAAVLRGLYVERCLDAPLGGHHLVDGRHDAWHLDKRGRAG